MAKREDECNSQPERNPKEHSSAKRGSGTSSENIPASASAHDGLPVFAESDKNTTFPSEAAKFQHPVEILSSDYGDDSLDDLPSASWLLGNSSNITKPKSPLDVAQTLSETNDTTVDLVTECVENMEPRDTLLTPVEDTAEHEPLMITKSPDKREERISSPQNMDTYDIWDDTIFDTIVLSADNDNPRNTVETAPLTLSDPNVPRKPKRKASTLLQTESQSVSDEKRLKSSLSQSKMANPTVVSVVADSDMDEWGDIDPLLLDEFKDIVNFF